MGYYIDIDYKVDEKNKVVIATTTVDWRRELDRLEDATKAEVRERFFNWTLSTVPHTRYSWKIEKFTAKAKWDGDETLPWDPEFGKALARARLVNKIDRAYVKMMDMVLIDMTKSITAMREICEKNWEQINEAGERRKKELNDYVVKAEDKV